MSERYIQTKIPCLLYWPRIEYPADDRFGLQLLFKIIDV